MKRLLILPAIIFLLLAAATLAFNLGLFHSQIENAMAKATGSKVKLGQTSLTPKWPLVLEIGNTSLENSAGTLSWRSLKVALGSLTPPYVLTLSLDEPKFDLLGEYAATPKNPATQSAKGGGGGQTSPVHLTVNIKGGDLKLHDTHLSDLNLNFEQKILLQSSARVHAQAFVQAKLLPVRIPLAVDTDNLTLSLETVKATDLKISFGGLLATAAGTSLFNEGRHRWRASVSAPDLGQLPKPPMDIPASNWRGSVQLKAEIIKEGLSKPWSVEGDVQAEKVSANLKYKAEKLAVEGPFSLELQSHFRYADGVPVIPSLQGSLDLSAAYVVYQDLVQKAPQVPLRASITMQGDLERLQLQNLQLEFWKFAGKVTGQLTPKTPYAGNFKFDVPLFSLTGAEKILLPLARSPVSGDLGVRGNFAGNLSEPAMAHWQVDVLKLKNFTASVDYDKPGVFKAKGPVQVTLEGRLEADKIKLIAADLKGHANLSDAGVVAGPLRKEAKQILTADFQARNSGETLNVQNFTLDSFLGKLNLSGKIVNPFAPVLQVKIGMQPLNLSELRMALPEWREKIPKGSVRGVLAISGHPDQAKAWSDWPLLIDGSLQVKIPEYTIQPEPPPAPLKANQSPLGNVAKARDGFLPGGHLTSRMKLKIAADVDSFRKDVLYGKGLHVDGAIASGHFKGSVAIREIFSGGVSVTALDVPLVDPRPAIQGTLKWHDLVTEDVIGFAKPEYRDFAKGKMAGTTDFMTYLPSDEEFLPFLKAKGEVTMQPVTLNTVKVGEMINALVKQLPMVKMSPARTDPLHGTLHAVFSMQKQNVQLDPLEAKDVDNSELRLKGKMSVPALQGDFAGTFFWAKPQVQGCLLEGNADATGRMIIPVAIKGDLMHPGLSSLQDLIGKLAGKALQCEQKKLVERVKKEGTKKLEDEVKKKLQGLFGH